MYNVADMTNQKLLGVILILFIIIAGGYFAFTKFKQEVSSVTAPPSPSPANLDFIFNEQSSPSNKTLPPQAQSSGNTELPLAKNKRLSQFPGILKPETLQNKKAVIQTAKGMIQIQIYPEVSVAASNFMILAANGFYDGLTFHRVEDWVVQGGDPLGNGTGGPGYNFPDEPVTREYKQGIVAYANSGPNTNGSQFFILKKDYSLSPQYTIFGSVIAGMDIVDKISIGDIMQKIVIQELK